MPTKTLDLKAIICNPGHPNGIPCLRCELGVLASMPLAVHHKFEVACGVVKMSIQWPEINTKAPEAPRRTLQNDKSASPK